MSKKTLPIFIPLVCLLVASLACSRLTGGGTSDFQATANAAFTQAAGQGSSAEATANAAFTQAAGQGGSAVATANAAATDAVATANAATGNTGEPTATPAAGEPTATAGTGGNGGGGPISGGPSDIPVIDADNTILLATAQLVSYQTKADFASVVKFYKDAMPANEWTADANTSVETANATVLAFTKGGRNAQVSVTTDPTSKQTIVLITIS